MRNKYIISLFFLLNVVILFSQGAETSSQDLKFAQVQFVRISENADGSLTFDVTVLHDDSGWDHYADLWIIVDPSNNEILGSRILAHPHVSEKPFTRRLSGVLIPEGTQVIKVMAKCNLHGYEGKSVLINLKEKTGEDYIIN